jgi:hypothetical protein
VCSEAWTRDGKKGEIPTAVTDADKSDLLFMMSKYCRKNFKNQAGTEPDGQELICEAVLTASLTTLF